MLCGKLVEDPGAAQGLATLDGLQFVLPQVVAQSQPNQSEPLDAPDLDGVAAFDAETPLRAVLLDGHSRGGASEPRRRGRHRGRA